MDQREVEKAERKAQEYAAMVAEREDRAKAWTPEEAASRAEQDIADYQKQPNSAERGFVLNDMALHARANPHYRESLENTAPDIAKEATGEPEKWAITDNETRMSDAEMKTENTRMVEEAAARGELPSDPSIREPETMVLNQADLDRIAAVRARDAEEARQALGLNTVEPTIEKEHRHSETQSTQKGQGSNQVESDEVFTARQPDNQPVVPPEIEKQYLRVGDTYYNSKNTQIVAFEDKGNRLETKSNSEVIAGSLVKIAEARGWDEIKVSGSETFRKEVWLEAASRGMQVKGYTPSEQDKAELAKRGREMEGNKVEKENQPFRARENEAPKMDSRNKQMADAFKDSPEAAAKQYPQLAGATAAVTAMDKKAEADGLNVQQRAIVMARVQQNVSNSIEQGDMPQVRLQEKAEVTRSLNADKDMSR